MAEADTVNEFMEQLINSALELEAEWADLSVMSRSKFIMKIAPSAESIWAIYPTTSGFSLKHIKGRADILPTAENNAWAFYCAEDSDVETLRKLAYHHHRESNN